MTGKRLTRRFFRRDPVTLAKALLGKVLVRRLPGGRELAGRIVEVEAYLGVEDRACHSYAGRRTKRNASMWLDGGHAYVYFVYGMHWCFNVVSEREGVPTACLIRAIEPLQGLDEMRRRRRKERVVDLCSGPAKLAQAMGMNGVLDGLDLVTDAKVFVRKAEKSTLEIKSTPRVGVHYAGAWAFLPVRFLLIGNRFVSSPPK